MRPLLALMVSALLVLAAGACGGSGTGARSASRTAASGTAPGTAQASTAGATPTQDSLRGDEDDDESAADQTGNNRYDNDADFDNDTHENAGYLDSDDSSIQAFGQAPSAVEDRAIAALVSRYFAAAAAGDGAKACPLIYSLLAEAIPEDFGRSPGPAYARGKTCAVVMSKIFKHDHAQLAGVQVTGVRVSGNEARALLGSKALPAGSILLRREHRAWKMDALLSEPLP